MWCPCKSRRLQLVGVFASQTVLASAAVTTPTVREDQQMTQSASHLIQDADRADQALQKNDVSAANRDIDDALALRTKLAQEAKADGSSMTVPLYADLDDTEYLSTVGNKSNSTGTQSATATSAKGAPQSMTVQSNMGQITYLAIDLDKTNSRLNAAKIALRNKNYQASEDTLASIGSNVIAVSVSTDLPLLTAREDLALARTALSAKNNQAASADLHRASQALTAYTASGPRAAEAKKLSAEIDSIAGSTTTPSATLPQTVDSWWQQVKEWFVHPSV
jgi:hypothetical protein